MGLYFLCGVYCVLSVSPSCALQVVTNARNTLALFKNLLGRTFSDPYVQALRPRLSYEVVERQGDKIGIKVHWELCLLEASIAM